MTPALFITGATGNVGVELCRALAPALPDATVRVLIRARDERELTRRFQELMGRALGHVPPGWLPVSGNVGAPDLGLGVRDRDAIVADTTHIINAAGNTSAVAPLALLRPVNVGGLERVVELARRCRRLSAIAHLSTCYVAGRRGGHILEQDLEHDAGWNSAYEQSKYEAELVARRAMVELPLSVYRLTILIGRRDGHLETPGGFQYILGNLWAGHLPLIPGYEDARIDFLPADHAVEILNTLFLRRFKPGTTYHIAAGPYAPSVGEWLERTACVFAKVRRGWREPMCLVAPEVFAAALERSRLAAARARVWKQMLQLSSYLSVDRVFDRKNTVLRLDDARPPSLDSYYETILRAGIASDWWRRRAHEVRHAVA